MTCCIHNHSTISNALIISEEVLISIVSWTNRSSSLIINSEVHASSYYSYVILI